MLQAPGDPLQGVIDTVFTDPKYRWVERLHPFRWLWDRFLWLVRWFEVLRGTAPVAYWAIVVAAVVALVAILVHAGWILANTIRVSAPPDSHAAALRAERRDASWYRRQAARLAAEGRFAEAMRAQFEAMVFDLAAAGLVRWHPSKTAREYVREAKVDPAERVRLATLVDGVYAASFAGAPFGSAEYEAWRAASAGGWRGA